MSLPNDGKTEGVSPNPRNIVDEREAHYGPCTMNHPRTQALWCAYLELLPGQPTAVDVCVLNILQKLARAVHDPTYEDNWVDIQGYAENILTLVRVGRWPRD